MTFNPDCLTFKQSELTWMEPAKLEKNFNTEFLSFKKLFMLWSHYHSSIKIFRSFFQAFKTIREKSIPAKSQLVNPHYIFNLSQVNVQFETAG